MRGNLRAQNDFNTNFSSMKRSSIFSSLATAVVLAFSGFAAQAQCTEIFMSEVCEGSGNNKGIEFFNPTDQPIDLSAYSIQRWANGELAVTDETQLSGTIPALGTWVLVNGQTEDVPLGGGAISPAVDPEMQALADQLDNPYPAPTYANGDDAFVLVKNGSTVVDIFGKPGEDPGAAWTDDAANGFVDVGDGATWLTANHTLRRKFDVGGGVTLPPVAFDTFLEWDTLPSNTWDGLGQHTCLCGSTNTEEVMDMQLEAFPNPTNGSFRLHAQGPLGVVKVFNANGELNHTVDCGGDNRTTLDATEWPAGVYFVQVDNGARASFAYRIVVQ